MTVSLRIIKDLKIRFKGLIHPPRCTIVSIHKISETPLDLCIYGTTNFSVFSAAATLRIEFSVSSARRTMPVSEQLASKQGAAGQEEGRQQLIQLYRHPLLLHREGSRLEHTAWSSYHSE